MLVRCSSARGLRSRAQKRHGASEDLHVVRKKRRASRPPLFFGFDLATSLLFESEVSRGRSAGWRRSRRRIVLRRGSLSCWIFAFLIVGSRLTPTLAFR